ncbi:MAG TPA: tRNA pseudouridine(55) synthase TruB [Syntrophomonas sp.]|nr:tRNA pseudouridine(55) synthase TruB [Syntrophomonas sp.]HRW13489.1 tRNA pseudouridine(55) synthase TruB [Syntrophomonas sp.]
MHGFLNINKDSGMTSFDVLRKIKQLIPKTKLGHLGTLDPMATGVLPVALGHATRLIEYIEDQEKTYRAQMTLGGVSDTQDAWGKIEKTGVIRYGSEELVPILAEFTGTIEQIPPMYSAVHHQGQRLYELARQGVEVERSPREVKITSLQMLSQHSDGEGNPVIELEITCSKGTYVRTLCHDIGQRLGTGAYMSRLTRTRAGMFAISQALTLAELEKITAQLNEHIIPLDVPLRHWPALTLESQEGIMRITNGNHIKAPAGSAGMMRIYHPEGHLMAIARIVSEPAYTLAQPVKVFK